MECPNCGDLLRDGARYCSKCGTRIREQHASGEQAPSPSETRAPSHPVENVGPSEDRLENARVGYRAALDIWQAQTRLTSSRFNVMIVANSIILGAISLTIRGSRLMPAFFTRGLSLVGIVVSLAWLHAYRRASQDNSYFLWSARELESYLADPVVTISRGATFSEGNEVALTIDGEKKKLRLGWLARIARTESFSYFVIAVFMLLYVALLFRF
jgi:hypothetical protein